MMIKQSYKWVLIGLGLVCAYLNSRFFNDAELNHLLPSIFQPTLQFAQISVGAIWAAFLLSLTFFLLPRSSSDSSKDTQNSTFEAEDVEISDLLSAIRKLFYLFLISISLFYLFESRFGTQTTIWVMTLGIAAYWVGKRDFGNFGRLLLSKIKSIEFGCLFLWFFLCLLFYSWSLTSVPYTPRSLESSFYLAAVDAWQGQSFHEFWKPGTRGGLELLPGGLSYYQAIFFKLMGVSLYSARFSTVLISLLGIFPLYVLLRALFGIPTAWLGVIIYGSSSYNYQFCHSPFNYVHFFLPIFTSLACLSLYVRTRWPLFLFFGGMVSALGLYLSYAILLLPLQFVVGLGFLLKKTARSQFCIPSFFYLTLIFIFGYLFAIFPMLYSAGAHTRLYNNFSEYQADQNGFDRPVVPLSELGPLKITEKRLGNLIGTALTPFSEKSASLFHLSGFRFDFISTLLLWWGILFSFRDLRNPQRWYPIVLLSMLVPFLYAMGFLNRYTNPAPTRNVFFIPLTALFAALGFRALSSALPKFKQMHLALILCITIISSNTYRIITERAAAVLQPFDLTQYVAQQLEKNPNRGLVFWMESDYGWSNEIYWNLKTFYARQNIAVIRGSSHEVKSGLSIIKDSKVQEIFVDRDSVSSSEAKARIELERPIQDSRELKFMFGDRISAFLLGPPLQ